MTQESRTILIIEDSAEDRATFRRYLLQDKQYSYQILETESGEEGLELCLTANPDAILLDYRLPDVDGLEFLDDLKARNPQADLPVIMLSGQGNESVAVAALKSGAADYLVKGKLTPGKLCYTVRSVVEQVHLKRQLALSQERQRLTTAIALKIRQHLNLEDILNTTVTEVRQILRCDRVLVYQFNPDMSGTIVAESILPGWTSILNTQIIEPCFQKSVGEDYRQGKQGAISNIYTAGLSACHLQLLEQLQVKANLVVPILFTAEADNEAAFFSDSSTRLWGLLIAHQCSHFRQWQPDEINLLNKLAVQISIAIEQTQLFDQLQTQLQERQRNEQILQAQKQVLEMMATGVSLTQILDTLTRNIEQFSSEMLCSILLLDANGRLRHGAGPNLPEHYNQAIDGIAIGDGVGCCGTAAYLGQPVIVADIASSPLWVNFRDLALSCHLAACWSYPIFSSSGNVLGTFAIYYQKPRIPNAKDLELIAVAARIAGIAIEQTRSKTALEESQKHYKILAELSPVGIYNTDAQGNCFYVNQRWCAIAGFDVEEALGTGWVKAIHPDDRERVFHEWNWAVKHNFRFYSTYRFQTPQGVTTWVLGQATAFRDSNEEIVGYVGTITDISDRKQLESELERRVEQRTAQFQESELRFRGIFNQTFQLIGLLEPDGTVLEINRTALDFARVSWSDCLGIPAWEIPGGKLSIQAQKQLKQAIALAASGTFIREEVEVLLENHQVVTFDCSLKPIQDEMGKVVLLIAEARDISDRKTLEQEVAAREQLLNAFFDAATAANVGLCIHDEQFRFVKINQALADIHGVSVEDHTGKTITEVVPKIAPLVIPHLQQVQTTGTAILNLEVTGETSKLPGVQRDWLISHFPIFDSEQKVTATGVIVTEITQRKRIEQELKTANAELTRSNQELEQFAYIASHDLQEPLRKIKSFTELLAEEYQGQLDEIADHYIHYINDGATRMQALINDLLTYSRVSRADLNKQPTDLNAILTQVKLDLSVAIAETNAIITAAPLPKIQVNSVQIAQLFQNIIANSLKFRGDATPEIQIGAQLREQAWLIWVRDNGIGIQPRYTERIFEIFQRLHTRTKYPGNGIGLALCRKIVERHGGQIWVESEPGQSTTFYFTLPV
jgi:PAS domain S-box-containing protein